MQSVLEMIPKKSDMASVIPPGSATVDNVMPQSGLMDYEPNWKVKSLEKPNPWTARTLDKVM